MVTVGSDDSRTRRAAAGLRARGRLLQESEVAAASSGADHGGDATGGGHATGGGDATGGGAATGGPAATRAARVTWLGDLEKRYASLALADLYDLSGARRHGATAHVLVRRSGVAAPCLPAPDQARALLQSHLDLVFGIGPVGAGRLRQEGVTSVAELADHDRHGPAAADVMAEWDGHDLPSICARLSGRLGERGHLLSSLACAMVDPGEVVFFDLETMGLWNNTVFLAGVGRMVDGGVEVRQYLAPSFADETAVVALALEELRRARVVVTFNGRTADLPWLENRAFYYGLGPLPPIAHVDLMYGTRGRFVRDRGVLPDVRLATVARDLLGLARPEHDVPSWLVPQIYEHYARAPGRRQGLLAPLVDHNRADLDALVLLLEILCREAAAWP
ncbi:MAG TPA: ribonuclease H-like domain-containing protein [Acidimicrobiales bacterium]|nr:ribonuclease H-like domain-containing protein [Acidimicrobiales bacterium]